MSRYDYRDRSSSSSHSGGDGHGIAPGKRSLTQSLPPVQRSLRDQQREVVDFDAAAGDNAYDARATVDAKPTEIPLTDRQIRTARRRNPHWVAKLKVSAQIFSTAEVDSAAFALDVAEKQAAHRLRVDGIAGPQTVATVAGQVAAARSSARPSSRGAGGESREVVTLDAAGGDDFYDQRATVEHHGGDDQLPRDDPFGMHLIDQT